MPRHIPLFVRLLMFTAFLVAPLIVVAVSPWSVVLLILPAAIVWLLLMYFVSGAHHWFFTFWIGYYLFTCVWMYLVGRRDYRR